MRNQILCIVIGLLAVGVVFSQPAPIEITSDKLPDSIKTISGPDGRILADNCPVLAIRMKNEKPGIPVAGKGIAKDEMVITKSAINQYKTSPGGIYFTMTAADYDEYFVPTQAMKKEKIIFRVFDRPDTTFPAGMMYADSPIYEVPSGPASIDQLHFGDWKKIPAK